MTRPLDDRIEIRCYSDDKDLLRRAAALDNRNLSNWLLTVGLREARRLLAEEPGTDEKTR